MMMPINRAREVLAILRYGTLESAVSSAPCAHAGSSLVGSYVMLKNLQTVLFSGDLGVACPATLLEKWTSLIRV